MHPWLYLLLAIVLEVTGTTCMKMSHGFDRPIPSVLTFVFWAMSITALIVCLKHIDVSVAYTIWAGLGTALIVGIGWYGFGEPMTPIKLGFIALIVAGVIGLQWVSGAG